MQEVEGPDYLQIKESRSTSDLGSKEEIKVQHVRPIGGNTIPSQYSREISRYQPSDKERIKAMNDAFKCGQTIHL